MGGCLARRISMGALRPDGPAQSETPSRVGRWVTVASASLLARDAPWPKRTAAPPFEEDATVESDVS
jgi:hypothetical protein